MGFAPKGLIVGDVFENDGKKHRVTKVIHEASYDGYETEIIPDEPEQMDLADIPFSDVEKDEREVNEVKEEAPKRRRRKTE
jgi:hypothetical protein